MTNQQLFTNIFKQGSTTYYTASLFFPRTIRQDVFVLYAFVRTADDFVDAIPQQQNAFYAFAAEYRNAMLGKPVHNPVIAAFIQLSRDYAFPNAWATAFLASMEQDISKKKYSSLAETEQYMYGSAEVVGLMMAKIMHLPPEAFPAAQLLGKSMQYINFIRDIPEDISLGRTYLPSKDLHRFGLTSLTFAETSKSPAAFTAFMQLQLSYYQTWQRHAEEGFRFILKRYLIPIKTASDMYNWTAQQISRDPFTVYKKKIKPTRGQIVAHIVKNML